MLLLERDPPQLGANHFAAGEEKDTRVVIMDALKQLDDLVHKRQLEWMALGSAGELMPIGTRWH